MGYEEIKIAHPKARKNYACEWCGEKISKSEKHLYRVYKFDGYFNNGRMHLECEQAMYKAPHDELLDGWTFGSNERGK